MTVLPVYELTIYEEDDSTVLFSVGTAPGHARPYLKATEGYPEQEVDFAKSAVSIGQLVLQIVDVRTVPADQNTGYITSQLPDADGYSQLTGHRAVFTEDRGSGAEVVLDGVVRAVRLMDSFAGYEVELRDIRERERATRAFTHTDTPTVLPRGVAGGYGVEIPTGPFFGGSIRVPVRAPTPLRGTYRQRTLNWGEVDFTGGTADEDRRTVTDAMREALDSTAQLGGGLQAGILIFDRWKVSWRAAGSGSAYNELTQLVYTSPIFPIGRRAWQDQGSGIVSSFRLDNFVSGGTLPTDGQLIEMIVQYDGPVTEDWPLHIQDMSVGEFIQACYDGAYSDEDPRIRYEAAALLALDTPIRGRIQEPTDDLRAWLEKHAYPIAHAAPTLNPAGEVSPTTYLLPDESVVLPHLDDDNCQPAGGGWSQGSEDAINVVRVVYRRDYVSDDPDQRQAGNTISSREVVVEHRDDASILVHGERPLTIESALLTAIGGVDGAARGAPQDEVGHQVAQRITRMATDRFVLGGQYFELAGSRSDADVESLKAGSWVTVGVSWMPDYLSGERGLSRLAQVVGRRNRNAAWCSLTLVDAGSANAPLFAPTLGTVTSDLDGVVSIPVTGLGSDARIDYAVGDIEPAATSGAWTFLARVDALTTVKTAPQTPGSTVWVRARSELPGRRPSPYTTAVDVLIPETPRLLEVRIKLARDGTPTVDWLPGAFTLGVLIEYEHHEVDVTPTFPDSVEADAAGFEAEIAVTVGRERAFSVRVTPYDGWTGAAVSGLAGPPVEATIVRPRAITAEELVESARGWNTDIVFTPSSGVKAGWTAGSLVLADGVVHAITAGETAEYGAAETAYIYWGAASPTVFQDTATFGDAVGERKLLVAIVRTVGPSGQGNATVIPIHGVAQWNGEHIVANSITADAIFGTTLAALFADLGIIVAGRIDNDASDPTAGIRVSSAYSKPATWLRYLDLAATGSDPFLNHPLFQLLANGDARFAASFDNLIRNPGAEASSTDLAPWRPVVSEGAWSVSLTDPRSGVRCIRFNPAGMAADARLENADAGTRWEAAEGDSFYFGGWAEGVGVGPFNSVQFRIYFRDAAGALLTSVASTTTGVTTSYAFIDVAATAPAGTAQVGFELRVIHEGDPGIIQFDDMYARRMVDTTLLVGTVIAQILSGQEVQLRDSSGVVRGIIHVADPTAWAAPIEFYGGTAVPGTNPPSLSIDDSIVNPGDPAIGFLGAGPTERDSVTGSRSTETNLVLLRLLNALDLKGLISNDTTP